MLHHLYVPHKLYPFSLYCFIAAALALMAATPLFERQYQLDYPKRYTPLTSGFIHEPSLLVYIPLAILAFFIANVSLVLLIISASFSAITDGSDG
jgi:hypothetical protein